MKGKSAPHLQIDHTRFSAYLPVSKHVTQGPFSRDRMTVIPIPQSVQGPIVMSAGFLATIATGVYRDPQTSMTLFFITNNPFDGPSALFSAKNIKSGKVLARSEEHSKVPMVSPTGGKPGESIFLVVTEKNQKELATRIIEGRIERSGVDTSILGSGDRFQRLYTSIPFQNHYRGCPVLDSSEMVVGVVSDSADANRNVVAIPSAYIIDFRKAFNSTRVSW